LNLNCSAQLKHIQKLLQFIYHCINFFLENFNFFYSLCCSGHNKQIMHRYYNSIYTYQRCSCSHQYVPYVASETSVIGYINCTHFIHNSITLTSSEYDVSSDGTFIGYINCTHFIHDSITLTSSEYDVSSDGTFS
ncbi:hypothetical protein T01_5440, partial [Trichinella spiralis]